MVRLPSVTPLWRHTVAATVAAGSRIRLLRRLGGRGDAPALLREPFVLFLPARGSVRRRHLHRRDLVLRTIGCPVRILCGDHVRLRVRVMECRIDHARRYSIGYVDAQRCFASAARELDPIAIANAALFGVMRVHLEQVFLVPERIIGAPRLRADVILRQDTAGGEQEWEARPGFFVGGDVFGYNEPALASDEAVDVHDRRTLRCLVVAGPLHRTALVVHVVAECFGEQQRDLPILVAILRRHDFAYALDAPLGISEGAVLFQERRTRQEDVGEACRLVEKQVLHHNAFHRLQDGGDVFGIGIGLQDVLALDVNALEAAVDRGVEHVGNAQAWLLVEGDAPVLLKHLPGRIDRNVPVSRKLVRERTHVAGALHVVLAAKRMYPDAGPADVARRHGKVGDRHDGGGALAVLGDAETVVNRAVAAGREQPSGATDRLRGYAGDLGDFFRTVARLRNELGPVQEFIPVAPLADEFLVVEFLGDDDMRQRGNDGDIGPGF